MKKLSTILFALAFFTTVSFVYASGYHSFRSHSQINFRSGSQINSTAPLGTIQGYSTHPSSTCGANATLYKQLLAAGATWQRTDLRWDSIQATSSASYVWTGSDCFVNDATAQGISTVLIIDATPTWAATSSCSSGCAPVNAATLATFCTAAATHYNGKVADWEIWNEENDHGNWGPTALASDYRLDLNACSSAIKAVNASDQLIFGGLEPTATSGGNLSITDFVTQAYAAGSISYDIMGQHPYSYPWGLTKGDSSSNGWQAMLAVRNTMNANGDSAKQIWITEVGAPTCGTGNPLSLDDNTPGGDTSPYMSLQAQKSLFQQIVATSTSAWTNIGKIFAYTLIDANSSDHSSNENCFGGAYYTNGQPKPAYEVLRNN
jgi:hypothetical protein